MAREAFLEEGVLQGKLKMEEKRAEGGKGEHSEPRQ